MKILQRYVLYVSLKEDQWYYEKQVIQQNQRRRGQNRFCLKLEGAGRGVGGRWHNVYTCK
jgi:hypothetical protein